MVLSVQPGLSVKEDREMLQDLYISLLSASLWMYLDSLLVEDMERVPSVQPGVSVMEDREMLQDRYVS